MEGSRALGRGSKHLGETVMASKPKPKERIKFREIQSAAPAALAPKLTGGDLSKLKVTHIFYTTEGWLVLADESGAEQHADFFLADGTPVWHKPLAPHLKALK